METQTPSPLLTDAQKQSFKQKGYVKLPQIVPQSLVETARRAINADLGQNGMNPDDLPIMRSQTYCRALTKTPPITDLYNASPLKSVAELLIGENKVRPVGSGQIALRFPSADLQAAPRPPGPHLDGMYSPNNGVKEGTIGNFTALLGVFLSDLPREFMGNFTVWPGTHLLYQDYFREHGPQSLLNGMPPVPMPQPEQFLGRAGDAALVHYQIAHGIAGNISPNIRYAIFFRLFHVDHDQNKWDCMTDVWKEWDGMR